MVGGTYSSFPPKLRRLTTSSLSGLHGGLIGSMGTEYSANAYLPTMLFGRAMKALCVPDLKYQMCLTPRSEDCHTASCNEYASRIGKGYFGQ
jgi:hypothetical protein